MSAAGDRDIERSARAAGLASTWTDAFGARRRVSPQTLRALLAVLKVDADAPPPIDSNSVPPLVTADAARPLIEVPANLRRARNACIELEFGGRRECAVTPATRGRVRLGTTLPPGYHALDLGGARLLLAAAPAHCFTAADALGSDAARAWGVAAQTYALRRPDDLGVGDFGALRQLAASAAARGAMALAMSPAHAMFVHDATRYSPYSPSHRGFLNVLHADASTLLEREALQRVLHGCGVAAQLAALRGGRLIDWPRAAAVHRRVFEHLFARFVDGEIAGAAQFAAFRRSGGAALALHACFDALCEYESQIAADAPASALPAAHSSGAQAFMHAQAERIAFHVFGQWCATRGLQAAQAAARAAGMRIGLIADLAVGVDPAGSECWSRPDDMLVGASIGAPPDQLNALGQDWGLTTFSPYKLVHNGYAPFLDVLRAAMRHAGGVRLDHVMSLMRLWLVPRGAKPTEGAYLRYPLDDLLRLIALESWRNRCIVIGEDLGTVPDAFRQRLMRAAILGLDVLAFMRAGDAFLAPRRWRRDAVAMTSTHDLAPVAGWWQVRDLDWRARLRLFGDSGEGAERAARSRARRELARALGGRGGLSERSPPARIVDAAIDAVARTPAVLALVPLEDLLGAAEQPNLPGTVAQHPNWRRRYRAPAARLLDGAVAARRVRRLARVRSRR